MLILSFLVLWRYHGTILFHNMFYVFGHRCVCVCIPCHLSSDLHEWLLYCCSLHIYIYTHIYIHIHVYLYLSSFIVVIGFKNFRLTCVWLLYCCSLQAVWVAIVEVICLLDIDSMAVDQSVKSGCRTLTFTYQKKKEKTYVCLSLHAYDMAHLTVTDFRWLFPFCSPLTVYHNYYRIYVSYIYIYILWHVCY